MRKLLFFLTIFLTTILSAEMGKSYGKELFVKNCVRCHGEVGEKIAFGRTRVIRDLSKEDFIFLLNGYKDKSYGGQMQYFMTNYVKDLDDSQMESLYAWLQSVQVK